MSGKGTFGRIWRELPWQDPCQLLRDVFKRGASQGAWRQGMPARETGWDRGRHEGPCGDCMWGIILSYLEIIWECFRGDDWYSVITVREGQGHCNSAHCLLTCDIIFIPSLVKDACIYIYISSSKQGLRYSILSVDFFEISFLPTWSASYG